MSAPSIAQRVAESRAAQGLPPKVADVAAISRIATVLRATEAGGRP